VTVAIWNEEVRSSESRKNEILAKTPFLKFGEFFLHDDIMMWKKKKLNVHSHVQLHIYSSSSLGTKPLVS
jgi:hypothetical protein